MSHKDEETSPRSRGDGLPVWVNITAVLVLLGLLSYSVLVLGTEGVPVSTIIGGLLAAQFAVNKFLKGGE